MSISDVVERTGVAEGTLRMWERRHGFPVPERLPSGHRRYSEEQVELVLRVLAARASGLSLSAAIERATQSLDSQAPSLFATLRRRQPGLEPRAISKRVLSALTHAIEDESLSRAERPLLFGSFQLARFYRQERGRWQQLSRGAALSVVFADFTRTRTPPDAPAEIPVDRRHPLAREWSIVCDAEEHGVALAGWEPPFSDIDDPDSERTFETIWSVEPNVVRDAARICASVVDGVRPELIEPLRSRLDALPAAAADDQLRLATAITNRTLSYLR